MNSNIKFVDTLDKNLLLEILDNTFMSIFVTDAEGKIIFLNKDSAELLGMERSEALGLTPDELIKRGILDKSATLAAMEKKSQVIIEQKTKTGTLFATSQPIFDQNGNIQYVITNSHRDMYMEKFYNVIEEERNKSQTYENVIRYFMESQGKNKEIVVCSQVMKKFMEKLAPVIPSDSTVLLTGESGVGKDVIANYIHDNGPRNHKPLIPVNCAAIPSELVESEFFGYEGGAFTGAVSKGKPGFFEMANGGTLFLDEIGELPLNMQSKLLRVMDTQIINRIGSTKNQQVDVRIIAATNRDLEKMVAEKTFRDDLYYRINVIPFDVPSLRNRFEDIIPLANFFLKKYNGKYGKNKYFSQAVESTLQNYFWPGNVRELKNVVERLFIMSQENNISSGDLKNIGLLKHQDLSPMSHDDTSDKTAYVLYKDITREKVVNALIQTKGNKKKAAELLGISRGKLYKLLDS